MTADLGDVDLNLEGFFVELDQEVALADAVVVIDEHPGDLSGDARGDEGDVAIDVGVIGGDDFEGADVPMRCRDNDGCRRDDGEDGAAGGFARVGEWMVGGRRVCARILLRVPW